MSFAWSFLQAGEASKDDSEKTDSVSTAAKYRNNPDDAKAFTAWLNETFKEISELIDTAPEDAEKKLAAAKELVGALKPEAVVIDRQGVIRLIRVGSGSKNAKAIHDMIEKLLADKPVAAK